MKRLSETFGEFDNPTIKRRVVEARTLSIWNDVVGELISHNTEPLYIRNGILYIRTKSPAWSQELTGLSLSIINRLNNRVGQELVIDIRFVSGPLVNSQASTDRAENENSQTRLTDKDIHEIKDIASLIHQEDLKETFERLMKKDRTHSKNKHT